MTGEGLAAGTVLRNADYRTEVAFWSDTVRKSPQSARAWNNLGFAYQQEERTDEARAAYEHALALDPEHIRARINLRGLSGSPGPRSGDAPPGTPR